MDHHAAEPIKSPGKGDEETDEQASRLRTDRAGARAGAADRKRSRRNRTDAAADAGGGFRPDRERALSRPVAAEHRRQRGAARGLHANAGGSGQGRCLHRMVPRTMQRLRHDGGLSRPRDGAERFSGPRPASWPGARSRARSRSCPAVIAPTAAGISPAARGRPAGSAPMSRSSKPTASERLKPERRAGNPHHPVSARKRHDVRRLGRDRPARHRHRFLFGRQSVHPGKILRAARRYGGGA